MKIEFKTNDESYIKELSYIDLINAIGMDVNTDESMPDFVKTTTLQLLNSLSAVLEPYSA